MNESSPLMTRGLFGIRRSAVNQLISDRDVLLRQAEGRVRAAEDKAARLESELAALQEANEKLQEETERSRNEPKEFAPDVTRQFVTEELAGILTTAEQSANRILERARASTQLQVAEAERAWREAQAEVARVAAWRNRLDPVLRAAHSGIADVRARIDEVPDHIRQALSPLADSVASLSGELATVAGTPPPPSASGEAGPRVVEVPEAGANGSEAGTGEVVEVSSLEAADN